MVQAGLVEGILGIVGQLLGGDKNPTSAGPMGYGGIKSSTGSILGQRPNQMTAYPESSEKNSASANGGGMNTILESILGQIGKGKTREYGLDAQSPYVQNYLQNYRFGR